MVCAVSEVSVNGDPIFYRHMLFPARAWLVHELLCRNISRRSPYFGRLTRWTYGTTQALRREGSRMAADSARVL